MEVPKKSEAAPPLTRAEMLSEGEMPLMEHLKELRKRLVIAALAIFCGGVVAYNFSAPVFHYLNEPFQNAFAQGGILIGTGPAEAFILRIKVAIFSGTILVSPVLFSQLWFFIAPGLYAHEKRIAIPFVLASTVLFVAGVWFCHDVVLPFSYSFFQQEYQAVGLTANIRISEHLSTEMTGLIGFGAVFEMPMLAFFLGRLGVVDDKMLIKYARHAIVIIFVAAAVLTPPDVLSQLLMAGPLVLLYAMSILVVRLSARKKEQRSSTP